MKLGLIQAEEYRVKKHSLILVMLIACSSCSLKYLFVKKEPTPAILSSAANAKSDCAKGIGESCYQYIKIYDEYKLGFKDDEAASTDLAILLTNVCIEKKVNEFCPIAVRVSYRYDNAPLLTKICFSTKDADSCSSAAKASFSKETFDQKLGLKALAYSCVKPNSYDCKWLLQKSIELKDAKFLSEKCNSGNAESCLHAGIYGRELKEDPRLRLKFYEKACALGEREGCDLAQLIPKSIVMYDCELKKSIKSCREASELLMKESMDEARKFAQFGCNANDRVSCAQVDKIDTLIAEKKREEAAAWAAVAQGFAAGLQAGAQANANTYSAPQPTTPYYGSGTSSTVSKPYRSVSGSSSYGCGIKPIPPIGHTVGRCVNGSWEMVSVGASSGINCGIKPIPPIGHRIGRCVSGSWEMISTGASSSLNCGIKPIPNIGCQIGRCVDGAWEQVCR